MATLQMMTCNSRKQEGKEDELVGRLQKKTGKTKDEVRRMISEI